ncbi:MAG: recombinase RecX [Flavobacteriales bacterium]|nr:recombinase RecX [Flavobacteriales bacterium]|tara:strand:- start:7476 stop:7937 length:462 start_codon:yes stop_codon:yes gene_type:complete
MKVYDLKVARQKIQAFCAYQERCHQEVIKKLKSWGLFSDSIDMLLDELIANQFLNEERFSKSFSRGKFRIKKWGKIKISLELKRRNIHETLINYALNEINEQDYFNTIVVLLKKKDRLEKEPNLIKRKAKLTRYMVSRGFEFALIKIAFEKLK